MAVAIDEWSLLVLLLTQWCPLKEAEIMKFLQTHRIKLPSKTRFILYQPQSQLVLNSPYCLQDHLQRLQQVCFVISSACVLMATC